MAARGSGGGVGMGGLHGTTVDDDQNNIMRQYIAWEESKKVGISQNFNSLLVGE